MTREWIESFAGDELTEHARNPEQRMEDAEMQAAWRLRCGSCRRWSGRCWCCITRKR